MTEGEVRFPGVEISRSGDHGAVGLRQPFRDAPPVSARHDRLSGRAGQLNFCKSPRLRAKRYDLVCKQIE